MEDTRTEYVTRTLKRLDDLCEESQRLIDNLGELAAQTNMYSERDTFESRLVENLDSQCLTLAAAFEHLGQFGSARSVADGFALYKPQVASFEYEEYTGCFWSPAQRFLVRYIGILRLHSVENLGDEERMSVRILENILAGTAMLMEHLKTPPQNEPEINRFMKRIVSAAFPDTAAVSIPTTVKVYKPEFGVPSLSALVEYKFANTEDELKQCLDGIMADSRGYQADGRWKKYYAVIFMTAAFFTPAQIEEQFRNCGICNSWKAIVLVGNGGRKQKKGNLSAPTDKSDASTGSGGSLPMLEPSTQAVKLSP